MKLSFNIAAMTAPELKKLKEDINALIFSHTGYKPEFLDQTPLGSDVYIKFIQTIHAWLIWQDETFKSSTPLSKIKHLQKEVGELITELELPEDKSRTSDTMIEYADCFVLLIGSFHKYVNTKNTNSFLATITALEMAMSLKLSINKKREWGEPDKDGVVLHKKTPENERRKNTSKNKKSL